MRSFLTLLAAVSLAAAHDIPSDITVQAFVRPAGRSLQLLVRVPLKAMRDIDFPETKDGYLDVAQLAPQLPDAAHLWISNFTDLYEGDTRLPKPRVAATRISFESDRSFVSWEQALAHVTGPELSNSAHVYWDQVLFDMLFEYPIQSDRSRFTIDPRLRHLAAREVTILRFLPPGGAVRAYEFVGRSGAGPSRSALASGRRTLRKARLFPHPRRHRPSAVPALPGHPVPPLPRPCGSRDRLHHCALHHALRLRL